jgi:hypothetical protein
VTSATIAAVRAADERRVAPVRLGRPEVRHFNRRPPIELAPYELDVMAGILEQFDMVLEEDLFSAGNGNHFTQMGTELLASLEVPLAALDLLILAYHLPDAAVADVAACALSAVFTDQPASFSISEQGVGAAFSALRVLHCMRVADRVANGAVLILDQSTSLYRDADTHDVPIADCAVLLRTDAEPGAGAVLEFVDEAATTDPEEALAEITRRHPNADIIVGRMFAEHLGPASRARVTAADGPRHLCTDPWIAVANRWPLTRPTIVADYDPHAGRVFSAGLRPEPPA